MLKMNFNEAGKNTPDNEEKKASSPYLVLGRIHENDTDESVLNSDGTPYWALVLIPSEEANTFELAYENSREHGDILDLSEFKLLLGNEGEEYPDKQSWKEINALQKDYGTLVDLIEQNENNDNNLENENNLEA